MLLQDKRIDVNLQDEDGKTVLVWTSIYGHPDVMKLLIFYGANSENPLDPTKYQNNKTSNVLRNWKIYLPKFSIRTCKYYPKSFLKIAKTWLLVCNRKTEFDISKDIRLLMLEYIAEAWKYN